MLTVTWMLLLKISLLERFPVRSKHAGTLHLFKTTIITNHVEGLQR